MTTSAEELRARLPHLTLDELVTLAGVDRATRPEQADMVEGELARRGVTGVTIQGHHLDLSSRHEKRRWFGWLNPVMSDEKSALRVTRQGAVAAWIVSSTTVLVVLFAQKVEVFAAAGIDAWALIDAALFGVIGIRIWKGSLPFAWVGVVFYLIERGVLWATTGQFPSGITALIFLAFVNGVRGAQAIRKYRHPSPDANGVPA